MKKFLAILLIAIVACETVDNFDLEGLWKKIKNAVKSAWDKLSGAVKKAINWLKDKGIYDLVKSKLIQLGKAAATTFCSAYLSPAVCAPAIEGLCTIVGI